MVQPSWRNVYFVGIGGIGMSALARYFMAAGARVGGYDRTRTPLTDALTAEGAELHYDDRGDALPTWVKAAPNQTLVVYTPAVPPDLGELAWLRAQGYPVRKRSEVLGLISGAHPTVAVAGTHGKTTTTTLVAHLLRHAGRNVTAFLGGLSVNYDTNLLLGDPTAAGHLVVVEADEYDRSFMTLSPQVAVLTSTDADHLDIYGDADAVREAYAAFLTRIVPGGHLIRHVDVPLPAPPGVADHPYGLHHPACGTRRLRVAEGRFVGDWHLGSHTLAEVRLRTPGQHNVENSLAAATAAQLLGLTPAEIRAGLETFAGVRRRFEYVVERPNLVYIDDYAHHPTEIEATLRAVRTLYPSLPLTVLFQPHLYSRTRDFAGQFARVLGLADTLWLLPVYPAREAPLPGVDSAWLAQQTTLSDRAVVVAHQVADRLRHHRPRLLVTMGAGDIDQLVDPIRRVLLENADN